MLSRQAAETLDSIEMHKLLELLPVGRPDEFIGIYGQTVLPDCLEVFLNELRGATDDVLPLLVLNEIQMLQRANHIVRLDHSHVAQLSH
eukprot:scaffold5061_cov378-Prasinococcus_capsulatus_cf.AAC.10